MKSMVLEESGSGRVIAAVFDPGDEVIAGLEALALGHSLCGASFCGIGALSGATLGWFDRDRKEYRRIEVSEQVEVLSLAGNLTTAEGEPKAHAHITVAGADGIARGGHLIEGRVWPTLEVFVVAGNVPIMRRHDPATGLRLIDFGGQARVIEARDRTRR